MGAALSLIDIGITSRLQRQMWQGEEVRPQDSNAVSSGHRTLDAALPGMGWTSGSVTEVLIEESGVGEIRLLERSIRELTVKTNRTVVFIAPPWQPNLTAFRTMKIPTGKLVWVKAPEDQVLWAAEQTLKQEGIGAVLIWLPEARPEAVRRLQVAAQESQALAFLFRPLKAARQSSAAPLRMVCKPTLPANAQTMNRREWMHAVMLEIDIIKRRGPLLGKPLQLRLPVLKPALPEHIRRADQARRAKLAKAEEAREARAKEARAKEAKAKEAKAKLAKAKEAREVRHVVDSGDIAAFIARSRQAAIDALRIGEFDFAWSEIDAD
jgi:protein ImuA